MYGKNQIFSTCSLYVAQRRSYVWLQFVYFQNLCSKFPLYDRKQSTALARSYSLTNRSCEILGCFWNYLEIFRQNPLIIISKILGCFRNHLKHFRWFEVWSCCRSEFEWRPIQSAKSLHSSNSFRNWLTTCVKQRPNWFIGMFGIAIQIREMKWLIPIELFQYICAKVNYNTTLNSRTAASFGVISQV